MLLGAASRLAKMFAARRLSSCVLPVPGPAMTSNGPSRHSTASRCSGFRRSNDTLKLGVMFMAVLPVFLVERTRAIEIVKIRIDGTLRLNDLNERAELQQPAKELRRQRGFDGS